MKTIETTAIVDQDRRMSLQLPQDVFPGEHRVLVVIDELHSAQTPWTMDNWPAHDAGLVDPDFTMRREELYGDEGRSVKVQLF